MSQMAAHVRGSASSTNLQKLEVLEQLESSASDEYREELCDMLTAAKAYAEGEAGDSPKYQAAALVVKHRWELYLAVRGWTNIKAPSVEMVEDFAVFMATTRQTRSLEGRVGLGDSAALLARYTLGQMVFPMLGYESWQGLSRVELKLKSAPFAAVIKDTWIRVRRAMPELKMSAKPFVKEKWEEEAVYQAQDAVYGKMDNGEEPLNSGLTRLVIMALTRATCQRPGSMGLDAFDCKDLTVWGANGANVLSIKDLTISSEGMKITLPDGTVEPDALRGEVKFNRLKHRYFEAQAGGYEYLMSMTADAMAVARRSLDICIVYLWRRGAFKVQYTGMGDAAIAKAVAARQHGHSGGMPEGAMITEDDAIARFNAGERSFQKVVEDEPLVVSLARGGDKEFTTREVTTRYIGDVFKSVSLDAGFLRDGGVNNMRRSTMVLVQKNAERQGFDPSMHAKRVVNHRGGGHQCREGVYEDCTHTTDIGAFLMNRPPECIEGLNGISATRCPELTKYRTPSDVPTKDPLWKLLKGNEELKTYNAAASRLKGLLEDCTVAAHRTQVKAQMQLVEKEGAKLEAFLRKKVLWEKRKDVYERHVEALKTMPAEEKQRIREVNSFEGVTRRHLLLRYGCNIDVPFDVDAVVGSRNAKGKGKKGVEFRVKWRGYKEEFDSWLAAEDVPKGMAESFLTTGNDVRQAKDAVTMEAAHVATEAVSESDLLTPKRGTVPAVKPSADVPSSIRAKVQKAEEGLLHQLKVCMEAEGLLKEAAMRKLAQEASVPLETLRKKVWRAGKRLEAISGDSNDDGTGGDNGEGAANKEAMTKVTFIFCAKSMETSVPTSAMVATLYVKIAELLNKPPEQLRLLVDGVRLSSLQTIGAVLSDAEATVDVFEEQLGGGGGSQDSPISLGSPELAAGGTQPDELAAGGTQPDEGYLSEGGTEVDVGSQEDPILLLSPEVPCKEVVNALIENEAGKFLNEKRRQGKPYGGKIDGVDRRRG